MKSRNHSLEVLEARIAPAAVAQLLPDPHNAQDAARFVQAIPGTTAEVHAGQLLEAGSKYLLYVQKGEALVFFTDLNNNGRVDFNEVTGIAAGDGLDLISFVDIHGDIVTNLRETVQTFPGAPSKTQLTLSDSDNNASNDDPHLSGDGRVLLDNSIAKITLRTLTTADVGDANSDGNINAFDANLHQAPTTFSIFGNIYAGKSFGTADGKGGLIIDPSNPVNFGQAVVPTIGSIKTGTAASGEFFSFGASQGNSSGVTPVLNDQGVQVKDSKGNLAFEQDNPNISGTFATFVPPRGEAGGSINGVHVVGASVANNTFTLNLDTLHAGDGGIGAPGGSIANISIPKDDSGGYQIIAGNGGNGPNGGNGGSVNNLADFGSTTSYVLIESGSGGNGSSGTGGSGGNVTFGNFIPRANVHLLLGNGGSGFTAGGNGSSLLSGAFSEVNAPPQLNGLAAAGDMHVTNNAAGSAFPNDQYVATIGSHAAVDFNNDGLGDYVFTTGGGYSQLVVEFGDTMGTFTKVNPATGRTVANEMFLDGTRNATALTVADLNGDGHPDIVVGSSDVGSQQGLAVYLSKYVAGKFVGFEAPRYSALPQLQDGQPSTANAVLPYVESPQQINRIVAGDFNGDGRIELAVLETQYGAGTTDVNNQVVTLSFASQAVLFLQPDVQNDYLHKLPSGQPSKMITGQFYADFGTQGQGTNLPPLVRTPILDFLGLGSTATNVRMEATALSTSATHDSLLYGVQASSTHAVFSVDYTMRDAQSGATFPTLPGTVGSFALGTYDAARPTPPKSSVTPVDLLDFSVFDYSGEGNADIAVLSNQSGGLLVGVKGDGTGSGTQTSGSAVPFGGNVFGKLPGGYNIPDPGAFLAIKTGNFLGGKGVLVLDGDAGKGIRIQALAYGEGPQTAGSGATLVSTLLDPIITSNSAMTSAFGIHYLATNDPESAIPGATPLDGTTDLYFGLSLAQADGNPSPTASNYSGFDVINYNKVGLEIHAGNGGNALLGKGGTGGVIGSGKIVVSTTNANSTGSAGTVNGTSVVGKLNLVLAGDILLETGNGGDGFSTGGTGGSVTGVNLSYRGNDTGVGITVIAGHGGRGVSGAGGSGGSVSYNSFDTALRQANFTGAVTSFEAFLIAGAGGEGNIGGSGGSIVGNGTSQTDVATGLLIAFTGNGGQGMHGGGSAGSILNYRSDLSEPSPLIGTYAGSGELFLVTGNGGSTVAGKGGAGGSVINSSPLANAFIDGTVEAIGGNGGNGATGGAGGQVQNLRISVTAQSNEPSQLTILGGIGGNGTSGPGGAGGSVSSINVGARGGGDPFSPLNPVTSGSPDFNRIIAGDGGSSSGNVGGYGGQIISVRSGSKGGAFALVSGAGGDGLIAGGSGGGVNNSQLDLGGTSVDKGLVIAGAGGNAFAFTPNTQMVQLNPALPGGPADPALNQQQNSFGGVIGRGGAGGSINGFTQTGQPFAHLDLIAGNGGSTANYGTIFDLVSHVGNGGGIVNVAVTGDLGNATDPSVQIKSYNDIQTGETIAQFVDNKLRTGSVTLDDRLGNVGVIVGVAGANKGRIENPVTKPLVKTFLPPGPATNGSLINISFNHLLAAVADSVDHIAAIQLVKNLQPISGLIGEAKNVPNGVDPTTFKGYIGTAGNPTSTPEIGGQLIDGAVVGKVYQNGLGLFFHPSGFEYEFPTGH